MESRAAARKAHRYMATPRAAPATKLPKRCNAIAAKTCPFKQGQSARILLFKPARPLGDQNFVGYPANATIEELAQSREPQQSPIPDNQRKLPPRCRQVPAAPPPPERVIAATVSWSADRRASPGV